ncbi:MAG TPA: NAD(P)-dependent oxidoreductase [Candidatus Aerophobetes bacterium]|uniref:NAD(P)-dependent oxidoreductase n=1 Tax=Aerophobetes bacterium TaxID=2030807 RepID=A0A7V5M0U4_UNCAE|nr:NAD(P)-dependent oxidoreductase [Candidatus Aerophobetes bacterium]
MKGKVGVVGVGNMGFNMVRELKEAGYTVFARDVDKKAEERAKSLGAEIVSSPKEMANYVTVFLLSLPMPSHVKEVVLGKDGILESPKAGSVIVDLSTVDPFSTQENAKEAEKHGIGYIDAPVLGRPQACGNWTLPVGGKKEDLEKVEEVLKVLAKRIIHVGPSGWGNIVKLLNNMMLGAINSITCEIFAICKKLGMNPKVFYETIAESGAASVSGLFKELGPKIYKRDFEPLFAVELLHKDMDLGIKMAKKVGVPLFVSETNQLLNEIAKLKGWGKEDTASVVKVYEDILGIEVKEE